jgi:hypothetical protein
MNCPPSISVFVAQKAVESLVRALLDVCYAKYYIVGALQRLEGED